MATGSGVTAPAIVATAVHKRFGQVHAARGIDLSVPRGACFGLIGANGAGKTTFIKMLLGIARPDTGSLTVLDGDPELVQVRRQIGYLPERLSIPEAFSAERFLWSVGRLRGMSRDEIERETPMLLDRVGLDRAAWRRRTVGYSKGMKQRTGLAAALLGSPRLLVLDEPTDGIDPLGRAQVRDVIAQACSEGATVFLNSHLLAESEKLCDHVAVLSQGKVVKSGPLEQLKRKDAVRARFVRRDDDKAIAARHGFVCIDERADAIVCRLEATDTSAISNALHAALGDGLQVLELMPELKDLEAILRESVAS
jgi:ABC-2 type transport system ATP-binding protein